MAKKKVFSIGSSLAEGLEETFESAQNYSGELYVDVVPLAKLELDPNNPRDLALTFDDIRNRIAKDDPELERKHAELESLQSLAHSIKSQGIINPVTVYKHNDKYRLIAGERRSLASLLVGKTDIQARILDSQPNELRISLLQWIENIERQDLSLWERLSNLEKIIEANATLNGTDPENFTVTELSQLIGCSKSHAVSYKAVLSADDQLKEYIADNKIKNLEKAALLANIASAVDKANAIKACVAGASLKELKTQIKQSAIKKPAVSLPVETRGRQSTLINLGATKNAKVAKIMIEAMLKHTHYVEADQYLQDIDWQNPRAVSKAFKDLLKELEKVKQ